MSNRWIVLLVGVAVVALVVALKQAPPMPPGPSGPPALAAVTDPQGRIELPLPVGGQVRWADAGPRILTASGGGLQVEAFDSKGPPVRALKLYELAVSNATERGDKVVGGDRAEGSGGRVEVKLALRSADGQSGHVRYLLRGQRYVQVRAIGPGSEAVTAGLRLP